jgi:hypothetical protein
MAKSEPCVLTWPIPREAGFPLIDSPDRGSLSGRLMKMVGLLEK